MEATGREPDHVGQKHTRRQPEGASPSQRAPPPLPLNQSRPHRTTDPPRVSCTVAPGASYRNPERSVRQQRLFPFPLHAAAHGARPHARRLSVCLLTVVVAEMEVEALLVVSLCASLASPRLTSPHLALVLAPEGRYGIGGASHAMPCRAMTLSSRRPESVCVWAAPSSRLQRCVACRFRLSGFWFWDVWRAAAAPPPCPLGGSQHAVTTTVCFVSLLYGIRIKSALYCVRW